MTSDVSHVGLSEGIRPRTGVLAGRRSVRPLKAKKGGREVKAESLKRKTAGIVFCVLMFYVLVSEMTRTSKGVLYVSTGFKGVHGFCSYWIWCLSVCLEFLCHVTLSRFHAGDDFVQEREEKCLGFGIRKWRTLRDV